jgi:Tfp pilus assembly pilus retraction ATPase PilT
VLHEFAFSDLYLGDGNSWLAGVPGTSDPVKAPDECAEELRALRELCDREVAQKKKEEFAIRAEGIAYRVSVLRSLEETVYVLRRFPQRVPDVSALGIHPVYVERLLEAGLTGLLVVAGSFGQGKTTTASSLIRARLERFGGVAITIEDPPEMPLEGRHGEGVCYQTWVERGGFGHACRLVARWAPSIIFVGEVRDQETAAEAMRASINGRLVVCTTHADSVAMTVERLFALANGAAGAPDDVASLLGNGLAAVLHQRLEGEPRRPRVECLYLGRDAHGARSIIRKRQFNQLQNEVTLQLNRTLMRKEAQA